MMRGRRWHRLAAATIASAMVLTACGGADDAAEPDAGGDEAAAGGEDAAGGDDEGGDAGDAEGGEAPSSDLRFVNVVKLIGVGWFDRMEEGIDQFASETGIDATQTGADDASPEKQVGIVEDLIAQGVDAITVVPNSPEALEGVFSRARSEGIVIVTHEAGSQQETDADIEAFDNFAYGATIMDNLAECMGEEGEYAAFVGQVTAESHMQWVQGAFDHAAENYPDITRVAEPLESLENADEAYEQTKQLMVANPNLKGIQGSASTDVVGAGRAIEELGLEDQVCVMGTSIPSLVGNFLETGAIDKIFFWDPALAGEAMMRIAQILVEGGEITEGTDLGLTGYESLTQSPDLPTTWFGNAWVIVDADNAADYPF
jgi:simple sugar transport system substrate-binding protein